MWTKMAAQNRLIVASGSAYAGTAANSATTIATGVIMPLLIDGEQRTEKWFLARRGKITASRAAAVLGLDPNCSAKKAWREITTGAYSTPNRRMLWGSANEQTARAAYEEETGNLAFETGFWVHPDHPWLGASPDGLIHPDGLLEAKCPYQVKRQIPVPVRVQVLVQLLVTGRQWCDVYYWSPSETFCERMHRPGCGKGLIAALQRWYEAYVVTNTCPPRRKRR